MDKRSEHEYAVKIFDVSTERATEEQALELRTSVLAEIDVMRKVAGNEHISEITFFSFFIVEGVMWNFD